MTRNHKVIYLGNTGMFKRFKHNILNFIHNVFGNVRSGVIVEKFDTSRSCTRTSRFVHFLDFSQALVSVKLSV